MSWLVNYIVINLLNSVILIVGIISYKKMLVIISLLWKVGIYGWNNWVISICKKVRINSIYIISIIVKMIYILVIWKYNIRLEDTMWYIICINIILISIWSLSNIEIKGIILLSSIIHFSIYWLNSLTRIGTWYIEIYLCSTLLLISVITSYWRVGVYLGIYNWIGIRRSIGMIMKWLLIKEMLGTLNIIAIIVIFISYTLNSYLYFRMLYSLICNHSNNLVRGDVLLIWLINMTYLWWII